MLGLGVILSLACFAKIFDWEQSETDRRAAGLAHGQLEKLNISILRSMEVLHSIVSLHAAAGRIDGPQFHRFVQQALQRQPELQALSWNPVIKLNARTNFEALASEDTRTTYQIREMGASGSFVIAGERLEYVPVHLIEPLKANAAALGFDLGSDASRKASLKLACDQGVPIATAPIELAQGPDNQAGFLVLMPAYFGPTPTTTEQRRAAIAGFAVAVFHVKDLVEKAFDELKGKGIEAELFDESQGSERLYGNRLGLQTSGRTAKLSVAGRDWIAYYSPTPQFSKESHTQSWLALIGGLGVTFLTVGYLYHGWLKASEIACINAALKDEVEVRQRAESAAAAANTAKSDFLASMSHEIRTPLNAILGYTQLMRRDTSLSQDQRDAVAGIGESGHHLLGLINEILDLSKIEAGKMELRPVNFDLSAFGRSLASTFRPLCAQKRIGFSWEANLDEGFTVRGDEGKLRQVLINLVGNAVKFTHDGQVYLSFRNSGTNKWLFEVVDTGLGIPEEERASIFKPFQQGSGAQNLGGTGLGLAIAQKQVELLGGRLEMQSERGIGSRFHFEIPLEPVDRLPSEQETQILCIEAGQTLSALVVDDNHDNRQVMGRMLRDIGCRVLFAQTARETMELVRAEHPQVVFIDLLLPDQRGDEVARCLKSDPNFGDMKIIIHTASASPEHRDAALASGCVDFLAKPFSCERLYDLLRTHLGVTFEYTNFSVEVENGFGLSMVKVELPEDLCARLLVAAELHSTTALKGCLKELRDCGPEAETLADQVRHLMRSYDMDGIARLIDGRVLGSPASTKPANGNASA